MVGDTVYIKEVKMRHATLRSAGVGLVLTLGTVTLPGHLRAQVLTDFCPEADESSEAAIVGIVSDAESEMILPGAEVVASWVADGVRQRSETQTGIDGVYTICGLPQGMDMQVRASLGVHRGEPVPFSTETTLQQFDLALSLTGDAPAEEEVEIDESARSGRAFGASLIRAEDLAALPEMSVYQLLRRHSRLRFERIQGGEVIIFAGRGVDQNTNLSGTATRYRAIQLFVDDRLEADPINYLRAMSIDEVSRIEILNSGEASARYGGDGWIGAIAISRRR